MSSRERVRRWTASPALASREFGWGGVEQPMTPAWNAWRDRVVIATKFGSNIVDGPNSIGGYGGADGHQPVR